MDRTLCHIRFGTARRYAKELGHGDMAETLDEILDERYDGDDALTDLAEDRTDRKAKNSSDPTADSNSTDNIGPPELRRLLLDGYWKWFGAPRALIPSSTYFN